MGRPRTFDVDDVLARAAALFARLGYDGASMDDLVRGLGVHRGSLYAAFGSKQGLFRRAVEREWDHWGEPLLRALARVAGPDPIAGLQRLLAAEARAMGTGSGTTWRLLAVTLEQAPHDPELAVLVTGWLARLRAAVGAVLERVLPAADVPPTAALVVSALLGLNTQAGVAAPADAGAQVSALARLVTGMKIR